MSNLVVTNARIIKGILTELQQVGGEIKTSNNELFTLELELVDGGDYIVKLKPRIDLLNEKTKIFFGVGKDYFSCELEPLENSIFLPPTEITISNRRIQTRHEMDNVSERDILSIFETKNEKTFGRVKNIDSNFIAITVGSIKSELTPTSSGVLNLYCNGAIIGTFKVLYNTHSKDQNGHTVIVLKNLSKEFTFERLSSRGHDVLPVFIQLVWPDEDGLYVSLEVSEISGLGFSGRVVDSPLSLPIGTIFRELVSEARLKLAWFADGKAGFSFEFSDPSARERLYTFISSARDYSKKGRRGKTRDVLSVLTRSGLLKSERAMSYGIAEKKEIFLYRSAASRRWLYQDLSLDNGYISFIRVSNDGWFIQELGLASKQGDDGGRIITSSLNKLMIASHDELTPRNCVAGIYDVNSKFNKLFWRGEILRFLEKEPKYFRTTIGSIKNKEIKKSNPNGSVVKKASSSNWLSAFSSVHEIAIKDVLSFYGLTQEDFMPRLLGDVLLQDEKKLTREVYIVESEGVVLGFALKLGLPPLSNLSSLTENLYLIPTSLKNKSDLIKTIFSSEDSFFWGIEDVCFIGSSPEDDADIKDLIPTFMAREFELVLFNLNDFRSYRER